MAYTKKLATITIATTRCVYTLTDTVEDAVASNALATLQRHGDIFIDTDEGKVWLPSWAVTNVLVTYEDSAPITPSDPC